MNSSCRSRAKGGMARPTFLRFDFFSSLDIISFFTCNAKGGKIKQKKVKIRVNREPRKGWKWRGKLNIKEVNRCRRGGEMLGGHIWTWMDIIIFHSKRKKGVEKGSVFIWDSDDITAQLNMCSNVTCHMSSDFSPQLPCICWHLGMPPFG